MNRTKLPRHLPRAVESAQFLLVRLGTTGNLTRLRFTSTREGDLELATEEIGA
jgi:hypothetical protein